MIEPYFSPISIQYFFLLEKEYYVADPPAIPKITEVVGCISPLPDDEHIFLSSVQQAESSENVSGSSSKRHKNLCLAKKKKYLKHKYTLILEITCKSPNRACCLVMYLFQHYTGHFLCKPWEAQSKFGAWCMQPCANTMMYASLLLPVQTLGRLVQVSVAPGSRGGGRGGRRKVGGCRSE